MAEHYPHFQERVRVALKVVLGDEVEGRIKIGLAQDGSGVGGKHSINIMGGDTHRAPYSCPLCTPGYEGYIADCESVRCIVVLYVDQRQLRPACGRWVFCFLSPRESSLCNVLHLNHRKPVTIYRCNQPMGLRSSLYHSVVLMYISQHHDGIP